MASSALKVVELQRERPSLALELPSETTFDEWVSIGRRLCMGQQALNWHIGDWWAFGDHRYGERAKAAAEGLFGREFQTLIDMATVSRRFETTRRRVDLSFTHHREVAALPAEQADSLLARAERENFSTRDLRREVQAIKAANDPEAGPVEVDRPANVAAVVRSPDAVVYAEKLIDVLEYLSEKHPPLPRRFVDMLAEAEAFVGDARRGAKAGQPPANFEVMFVEKGRLACETIFGKSRLTINHWLIALGKNRLTNARAEYVRFQRDQEADRPEEVHSTATGPIDQALHAVAREAASFLRVSRYGGWTITSAEDGTWLVGTVRKTPDELIAMAERQGFDSEAARKSTAALQHDSDDGVEG